MFIDHVGSSVYFYVKYLFICFAHFLIRLLIYGLRGNSLIYLDNNALLVIYMANFSTGLWHFF